MSLSSLLASCITEARAQGYTGPDAAYTFTAEDLRWVVEQFGRKPTREEWADVGLAHVGDAHIADE